jgi:hypothetical protein
MSTPHDNATGRGHAHPPTAKDAKERGKGGRPECKPPFLLSCFPASNPLGIGGPGATALDL